MKKLVFSSATSLAKSIRLKEISCQEIMEEHFKHLKEINSKINALVCPVSKEECLKQAREADEKVRSGSPLGLFHGVPFTVKDCLKVKGLKSSFGCTGVYKNPAAIEDATVVQRLKKEGAIVLGLTNVPEMLACFETDNDIYGQTKNPYDLSKTPGGSSGGCSSLIAAGGTPFSIGSDAGGSIRWPAHCTGIAGLKPTQRLVPSTGGAIGDGGGMFGMFGTAGPMARYVEDLEMGLSIMAGTDGLDPNALSASLLVSKKDLSNMKIAFYTDDGFATPTQDIQECVEKTALALEKRGAKVVFQKPEGLENVFRLVWETVFLAGDRGEGLKQWLNFLGVHTPSRPLQEFLLQAEHCQFTISELRTRLQEMDLFRRKILSFMQPYDILLSPVAATTAKYHGSTFKEIRDFSYAMTHNLTGWPAAVVRCGTSHDGLPIGIQIAAKPWHDLWTLSVAKHLEEIFGGWQPPIFD